MGGCVARYVQKMDEEDRVARATLKTRVVAVKEKTSTDDEELTTVDDTTDRYSPNDSKGSPGSLENGEAEREIGALLEVPVPGTCNTAASDMQNGGEPAEGTAVLIAGTRQKSRLSSSSPELLL